MTRIQIKDLKKDDKFFERHPQNNQLFVPFMALEDAYMKENGVYKQWFCNSVYLEDQNVKINFLETENLSQYAPKIYKEENDGKTTK